MVKLRRVLYALDAQQAIDLLLAQLSKTRTNIEFLMQVAKNTPRRRRRLSHAGPAESSGRRVVECSAAPVPVH